MEIKVKVNTVTIADSETGESYKIRTVRHAKDIADELEENEKDVAVSAVEDAVYEALHSETTL